MELWSTKLCLAIKAGGNKPKQVPMMCAKPVTVAAFGFADYV
jgi:hypothetical protein